MNIGLIGYRRHAARLLGFLLERPEIARVRVFHPERARLELSGVVARDPRIELASGLDALAECDGVVIASPSDTHVPYLRALLGGRPHILCEKPPGASASDLEYLSTLGEASRDRIAFNFNYRRSGFALETKRLLATGEIGEPIWLQIASTHGFAFRAKDDWRAMREDVFSNILGNVGIHYLDLALTFLGSPRRVRATARDVSRRLKGSDTVSIEASFECGATAHIFLSYAAPLIHEARLVCANGIVELRDGRVDLRTPRDTFDAGGRFAVPPSSTLSTSASAAAYTDDSHRASIAAFLAVTAARGRFPAEDFARALESTRLVLESWDRLERV